ncbi:MAG: DUF2630 family protein [Planctomycetota bacterium]|nr:DUF2630 family protein [Planctomycetota bacterium]
MNEANQDSLPQIEQWLDQHWDEIGRRAAARTAGTVFWNRRIQRINGVLGTAVLLMAAQVASGFLLLTRLQGVASSLSEIVRLTQA